MKRIKIVIVLILLALFGCTGRTNSGRIVINLDKPSLKNINLNEYCERIEIISLDDTNGVCPESKFRVFDKGFFIQKDSTCLDYFDNTGCFQQGYKFDRIIDFSVYNNKKLYILTSDRIEVYDLNNMSHECDLPLQDTSFTYCKVAGRDDNYVVVIAIRDGIEYSGHYDIKNQACYLAEGTIKGNNNSLRKVLGNSGFFYSDNDLYFFYSHTGTIYRMADFFYLSYLWSFEHKSPIEIKISNVQKTSDKLFMQIETDSVDYCLIMSLDENGAPHITELYLNSNTPYFPLGVFYNSTNYYLCESKDIFKYVSVELFDDGENQSVDVVQSISRYSIIKYHLK